MRSRPAFTLLELLVVLFVIGILATLTFPIISSLRARAQRVQCTSNLRNLYIAANLFVQQNGSWPQIPMTTEQDYAKNWMDALAPFGPSQQTWTCPTVQELLQNPDLTTPENVRVDYIATPFDDKPATPHQWPTQPWFVERADVHGHGNLIIFTDGSISDLKTVAAGQGKK